MVRKYVSPLKGKPLRNPGQSVDEAMVATSMFGSRIGVGGK